MIHLLVILITVTINNDTSFSNLDNSNNKQSIHLLVILITVTNNDKSFSNLDNSNNKQ